MNELSFFSAAIIGLAGGIHCVGMCGGLSLALARAIPPSDKGYLYAVSYNFGRITSYTVAGMLTGALGYIAKDSLPFAGPILSVISGLMLVAMACYLGNWWRGLTRIEAMGKFIWHRIQPLSKGFLPFKSPLHAFPYGIIWGWLPCGLVYSTLTWSLASGSALSGTVIMAGFGMGTLPTLLATWAGANWLLTGLRQPMVRQLIAMSLLVYALFLLWRAISSMY